MKYFLALLLTACLSNATMAAECTPAEKVVEKKVEKKDEVKVADEKPQKKKHKKYEGHKVPGLK